MRGNNLRRHVGNSALSGCFRSRCFRWRSVLPHILLHTRRAWISYRYFFGSVLLVGAFSGLISFGVFQIHRTLPAFCLLPAHTYSAACSTRGITTTTTSMRIYELLKPVFLAGLEDQGGIVSAATFRQEYAPERIPTLAATAAFNVTCTIFTLRLGGWMKMDNRRRHKPRGVTVKAGEVKTSDSGDGEESKIWRCSA